MAKANGIAGLKQDYQPSTSTTLVARGENKRLKQ